MPIHVPPSPRPEAVLFDRDGTLIYEVPYNTDPGRVRPLPGAAAALDRLRRSGVRIGVLTDQSGVGRGLVSATALRRVHRRIEDLLGRIDVWQVCVHAAADGCSCRRPAPGLISAAARRLRVAPSGCVMIGHRRADMTAAAAAGAVGMLVPSPRTRPEEISAAPVVATDLPAAIDWVLGSSLAGAVR
jgi:histidinol-phosphate phosphatase family protein